MGNSESNVNPTGVGVAVGFGVLAILFAVAIFQFCRQYRCKRCKRCCKKKEPSFKDKMLNKVGLKTSPPFTISSIVNKKKVDGS